jgi:hypothetical protein
MSTLISSVQTGSASIAARAKPSPAAVARLLKSPKSAPLPDSADGCRALVEALLPLVAKRDVANKAAVLAGRLYRMESDDFWPLGFILLRCITSAHAILTGSDGRSFPRVAGFSLVHANLKEVSASLISKHRKRLDLISQRGGLCDWIDCGSPLGKFKDLQATVRFMYPSNLKSQLAEVILDRAFNIKRPSPEWVLSGRLPRGVKRGKPAKQRR